MSQRKNDPVLDDYLKLRDEMLIEKVDELFRTQSNNYGSAMEDIGFEWHEEEDFEKQEEDAVRLTTIRDILKRANRPPSPAKTKSKPAVPWSKFVSTHKESLAACDFFTKPVYTLRGKFDAYVLVFLHLGSRRVYMSQPTFHPDEAWVMQQARNVSMWHDDHGIEASYLIRDRDTKFTRQSDAFWWIIPALSIRLATSSTI